MKLILLACAGGALGAGARFWIAETFAARGWGAFPWATLLVNVAGSLLMGALIGFLTVRGPEATGLRVFLASGVLGGFTTFSAFSLDAWLLAERGQSAAAFGYVAGSVVLSIAALAVGILTARAVAS